ncbi:MAG TPA: MFS transporter [Caulobacteraceae bacterium]|nr:MFS transporter [Caulobacteraceae bacterium]
MSAEQRTPAPAGDSRALYVLLTVVFINMAGFGVVIPLLPFYAKSFGAPEWQVFVLFSAYSLGNFFAEPLWGRLSDRIGRRPVLMMTIAGNGLSYLALAFAPTIGAALAIRFASGLLAGNISTIQGYVADVTPPERRAGRMGLMGAAFSMGFVTGPTIGGLLAHPEAGTAGFRPPLYFAFGLCVLAFFGVLRFVRETRPLHSDAPQRGRLEGVRDAFRNPVIWRVISVSLISVGGFAGMEASFGLWSEAKFDWGPREIGLCFMVIGLSAAFAQSVLAGRLARRFGETVVLMGGLSLIGLGFAVQPFVTLWPIAVIAMITVALGQSLSFPNIGAIISHASPPDRQGEMLGLNMAAMALARIIGPLAAAPLFALHIGGPFAAAALLIIPALYMASEVRRYVLRPA